MVDRLKDIIVTGAENLYSIEGEAALRRHEAGMDTNSSAVASVTRSSSSRSRRLTTATPDQRARPIRTLLVGFCSRARRRWAAEGAGGDRNTPQIEGLSESSARSG